MAKSWMEHSGAMVCVSQSKVCDEQNGHWWLWNRMTGVWDCFKMPEMLGLWGLISFYVASECFKIKKQYLFEESSSYKPSPWNTRSKSLLHTVSRLGTPLILFGEQDLMSSSFDATVTRQNEWFQLGQTHLFSWTETEQRLMTPLSTAMLVVLVIIEATMNYNR